MPTYEYRCDDCNKQYDVFHKVREIVDDVVCPICKSTTHTRLMSASAVSMSGYTSSASSPYESAHTCSSGSCCGGSCNTN